MDACQGATSRTVDTTNLDATCEAPTASTVAGDLVVPAEPMVPTGNLVADVMRLCERSLAQRQQQMDQRREASEKRQRALEDAQVEKMREEARDTFAQAIASCAFSLAASGAQAVSGGLQIEAGGIQGKAAGLLVDPKHASWLNAEATRAMGYSKLWDAIGSGTSALGTAVSGALNATVKADEADAKSLEHAAGRAGRQAQSEADASREMRDLVDKTMQRLEQILEGEQQTRLALVQRA